MALEPITITTETAGVSVLVELGSAAGVYGKTKALVFKGDARRLDRTEDGSLIHLSDGTRFDLSLVPFEEGSVPVGSVDGVTPTDEDHLFLLLQTIVEQNLI